MKDINQWRMIREHEPPPFTHIVMLRQSGKTVFGQTDRDGWLAVGEDSSDPDVAWMLRTEFEDKT